MKKLAFEQSLSKRKASLFRFCSQSHNALDIGNYLVHHDTRGHWLSEERKYAMFFFSL